MFDTFESVTLPIGSEVLIRAPGEVAVTGVVLGVDEQKRSVIFTDGRVYAFPPEVVPDVEVEP